MARQFLELSSRDKLILAAVANRNSPTEAGDLIEATVAQIEATLAKGEAEREADLAAVRADVEKRLSRFALILAQINPSRRATVTAQTDGSATFTPADAATARSTPCRHSTRPIRKRGFNCQKYNSGEIVVGKPQDQPQTFNGHIAHEVQGCHNCRRGTGDWCINCRRVSLDDIRIERSSHNVRPELTEQAAPENPGADAPRATNLPEHIEAALRLFFATFATLPHVGILYLAHRATHRRNTFADFLRQFAAEMALAEIDKATKISHRYGRATILSAWNSIVAKNPDWRVFRTWKRGHSRWDAKTGGESGRRIEDAQPTDRTFDRRDDIGADRDEETTRYFYPDDGTDW